MFHWWVTITVLWQKTTRLAPPLLMPSTVEPSVKIWRSDCDRFVRGCASVLVAVVLEWFCQCSKKCFHMYFFAAKSMRTMIDTN